MGAPYLAIIFVHFVDKNCMEYIHHLPKIEYFRLHIEYLWNAVYLKKDRA